MVGEGVGNADPHVRAFATESAGSFGGEFRSLRVQVLRDSKTPKLRNIP